MSHHPFQLRRVSALLAVGLLGLSACGGDDDSAATAQSPTSAGQTATTAPPSTEPVTLRLGYFPNVTHAPAIVGVDEGIFEEALADNVTLQTSTFNAGPAAVEALFAEALDATFIGPNPAINAYAQSKGEAIRIISGATSGGAFLVVREGITTSADLEGTKIATPQLGNTQDVALRAWLKGEGLSADLQGGGDVSVVPQENAQSLETFVAGEIDGACVPEPWATRFIQEAGAKVLVDERDLWPEGEYVTTHLIVRTEFLNDHPDVIEQLITGEVEAVRTVNEGGAEARTIVNAGIEKITGKALPQAVIDAAWGNLTFTVDPIASSLAKSASDAEAAGLLEPVDLSGIYDLSILNKVLSAGGQSEVKGL